MEEHERFLKAIQKYPKGPWKAIASIVKTRTIRQTQTHAQKYREKLARHDRGLRSKTMHVQDHRHMEALKLLRANAASQSHSMMMMMGMPSCMNMHSSQLSSASISVPSFPESMDFLIQVLEIIEGVVY
jgi:SHAQKYF class myb-like DNA-binding protein